MADNFKLNYPIETEKAKEFWGSKHRLNRIKAIIAFSLNLDNANDNLRRAGYYRQYRKRYLEIYDCLVNNPRMDGTGGSVDIPLSDMNELWYDPIAICPLVPPTPVNITIAKSDITFSVTGYNHQAKLTTLTTSKNVNLSASKTSGISNGDKITVTITPKRTIDTVTPTSLVFDVTGLVDAPVVAQLAWNSSMPPATAQIGSGTLTATWKGGVAPYSAKAKQGTLEFNDEEVDKADASVSIDLSNPRLVAGDLDWEVTDHQGTVLKGKTTLSVVSTPALTVKTQPVSAATASTGGNVTFTAEGQGGTGTLHYQWKYFKTGDNISTAKDLSTTSTELATTISGAKANIVHLNGLEEEAGGYTYFCVISDDNSQSVTTNQVTIPASTTPVIDRGPVDDSTNTGGTADFSVTVTASGDIKYKWQSKSPSGNWTDIANGTNYLYHIASAGYSLNGYKYRCFVTHKETDKLTKTIISPEATLTVNKVNLNITKANLAITYTGTNRSGTAHATTPAHTTVTISPSTATLSNGDTVTFTVVAANGYTVNGKVSDPITDTVSGLTTPLVFKTDLDDENSGPSSSSTIVLSVEVEGGIPPYTYDWLHKNLTDSAFYPIAVSEKPSAKTPKLSITGGSANPDNLGSYKVIVGDASGLRIESKACTLVVT